MDGLTRKMHHPSPITHHVIKIGGAAGLDHAALCEDIAQLWREGERLVIVHGGSEATDRLAEELGHPMKMVVSPTGFTSRYTDRRTLEIFAMATAGLNRQLVEQLQRLGVPAWGLSGLDGGVLMARRKAAIRSVENGRVRVLRDDWTGTPEHVDGAALRMLLNHGYVPVLAPIAVSEQGEMLNVDGDRAAALVAGALEAQTLVLLSNVAGLLQDYPHVDSLVEMIDAPDLPAAMEWAQGRMKKKLLGAQEALERGVERVIIGDGRISQPISAALNGAGTHINLRASVSSW